MGPGRPLRVIYSLSRNEQFSTRQLWDCPLRRMGAVLLPWVSVYLAREVERQRRQESDARAAGYD